MSGPSDFGTRMGRVVTGCLWAAACWMVPLAGAQVGGLDPSFDAGAILNGSTNGIVHAAALTTDGDHLIAGEFTSVGGVSRGNIAKLGTNGAPVPGFAAGSGANGPIHAIRLDSTGRLLIGGDFTTYDGVERNRIARLTTTGALDTTFDPGAGCDGPVYCIAVSGSSIYIGGDFTSYNGTVRNRLAVLGTTGTLGSFTFGGGANAAVRALSLSSAGSTLYVGGDFTAAGGMTRSFFAEFFSFSGTLTGTNLGFNGPVRAIEQAPSTPPSSSTGFYVGGDFTQVGAIARGRLALFTSVSFSSLSLDRGFNFWLDAPCRSIQASGGTRVYVAGDFTSVNGQWRSRVASMSQTAPTSGSAYWDLVSGYGEDGPDGPVRSMAQDSSGRRLLAGSFAGFPSVARNGYLRIYGDAGSLPPGVPASLSAVALSDTQIHASWSGVSLATAYILEASTDGTTGWGPVFTGSRTSFTESGLPGATPRFYRVRASNSNGPGNDTATVSATTKAAAWSGSGSVLPSLPSGAVDGAVSAILRQADGRILLAGSFSNVLGSPRKFIARLLPDLTLDTSFDPGQSANSSITQMQPAPNGGVYIYGDFSTVAGSPRNDVARLTASGALDAAFDTGTDWTFAKGIAVQPDGKLIIYGNFQTFFSSPRDYLARLNLDGSVDTSFQGVPDWIVDCATVQNDGRILAAGWFRAFSGIAATNFARLRTNGLPDPTFVGTATSQNISSLVALPTGQHLASGSFTNISGVARRFVARLNANGSVDTTFDPGASTSTSSPLLFPQPNGKLIVTGGFTSFGGSTRWKIARLGTGGALDATFDAEAGPDAGAINAVLTLPDGSLLVGGTFTNFGATPWGYLAHLKGDGFSSVPSTPQNLAGASLSSTSIALSWDQLPDEYSWKLERSPAGTGAWQQVAEPGWDVTSFTDTVLFPNGAYDYRIRAWNAAGHSPYSAVITARTLNLYQQWKVDRNMPGGAQDNADADGDGASLFLEYALGLNPAVPDLPGLPVAQRFGGFLTMTYAKLRPELNYSVEASRDLIQWSPLEVNQGSGLYPTAWIPTGTEPGLFLRLRVTQ